MFQKTHIFIKLLKTGFGHFPGNTIERLGFDQFFGTRSRDKVDWTDVGRHLLIQAEAKRGSGGAQKTRKRGRGSVFGVRSAARCDMRRSGVS